jgi:hypothetical protein
MPAVDELQNKREGNKSTHLCALAELEYKPETIRTFFD